MNHEVTQMNKDPLPLPTVPALVETVRAMGLQCASMVRQARPDRPAGVAVVMLPGPVSESVMRFCGRVANSLPAPPDGSVSQMDERINVGEFYAEIERLGLQWGAVRCVDAVIMFFVGDVVTPALAESLTTLGCPTMLL